MCGNQCLQREGGADDAQVDRLAVTREREGDTQNDDDTQNTDEVAHLISPNVLVMQRRP
jgi:hypothetical protein